MAASCSSIIRKNVRPGQTDRSDVDPRSIKNQLSEYGNTVLSNLWLKNGCPDNILIRDQKLGCSGELRNKRFGLIGNQGYDGVHMRGPLGSQHYTNATFRIFQELDSKLLTKPFPKVQKSFSSNMTTKPPPLFPFPPPGYADLYAKNRSYGSKWQFPPAGNGGQWGTGNYSEHQDCPQTRYQQKAGSSNSGTEYTIPTQNRFQPFYSNQGNF